MRRSKTVVINIEEEEPEEAESPCPSTRKSRIARRMRNVFRSSSKQLPVDGSVESIVEIENHDEIDEDLEEERYQRLLAKYNEAVALKWESRARAKRQRAAIREREAHISPPTRLRANFF